jgi:hypothetical protein
MAMVSTLQIFMVGLVSCSMCGLCCFLMIAPFPKKTIFKKPLLFLVADNPSVSYYVRCFLIFGVSMSFLLFLFVPKIIAWKRVKPDETLRRPGAGLSVSAKRSFGGNAVSFCFSR